VNHCRGLWRRVGRHRAWNFVGIVAVVLVALSWSADSFATENPRMIVGINGGHPWWSMNDDELDRQMTDVARSGAAWVRIGADWAQIEAEPGKWDWSSFDRPVLAAQRHGLNILGILHYTPGWAQLGVPDPANDKRSPDPSEFGEFAGAAAARYRPLITTWEVWNEPNVKQFFAPKPDVPLFAEMLRASYSAIRAQEPQATVIVGGLAASDDNGTNISPATFVRELYALGANRYFDAIGVHPYSFPELPTSPSPHNAFRNMSAVREIMNANGDSGKFIWPTEFGAPTGSARRSVSEEKQAEIIEIGLSELERMPNVGPVFIHTLSDRIGDPRDEEQSFGILRVDGSPKPAFDVIRHYTGKDASR
jgi:polysaccharide biosynthesis protein PslG